MGAPLEDSSIASADESSSLEKRTTIRLVRQNRVRIAIVLSLFFHVVLVAGLIFVYVPRNTPGQLSDAQIIPNRKTTDGGAKPTPSKFDSQNAKATIQESVKAHFETSIAKPNQEKLEDLDGKLQQLNSLVDKQSLNATVDVIAGVLGIAPNQYQEKSVSSGSTFNPDTAQLIDVIKSQDQTAEFPFVATMIDADGNKSQVPLSESEGEVAFETFRKMKQFPMAEGLYRKLVMPMLQRLIQTNESEAVP